MKLCRQITGAKEDEENQYFQSKTSLQHFSEEFCIELLE